MQTHTTHQPRNVFALYVCQACGEGYDDPEGESHQQTLSPCCGSWDDKPSTTFGNARDIPIMSFEAFQKSRVRVYDLRKHFSDTPDTFTDENNQGYVYLDGRYWISDPDGGPYWLLIERDELSSTDLDLMERSLYNYAVNAGDIIEDEPPTVVAATEPTGKPLAKSLHTITVLENVAKAFMLENGKLRHHPDDAMKIALNLLGYADAPDPYGLVAAARKKLDRHL